MNRQYEGQYTDATGVDPYFAALAARGPDLLDLCQRIFTDITNVVDVDNYTLWSQSKPFDKGDAETDDKYIFGMLGAMEDRGLPARQLNVILYQYFFADPTLRAFAKDQWVRTVVYPPNPHQNYFPSGSKMNVMLDRFNSL